MSTFFGGEQLVEIKTYEENGVTGASKIIYTVPTGRYAVVSILFVTNGFMETRYNYDGTSSVLPLVTGAELFQGDQVQTVGNTGSIYILIKEYLLP